MDVAFIDETAYVSVTLVSFDFGGSHVVDISGVDGPNSFIVVVDIGKLSINHPTETDYFLQTGI